MLQRILIFTIIFFHLTASSQEKRVDSIEGVLNKTVFKKNSEESFFEGSSKLIGKCTGRIYNDSAESNRRKIIINYFGGEILFFVSGKELIKIQDNQEYYLIDNTFYNKNGIKIEKSETLEKLNEYKQFFKVITITTDPDR